MTAPLMTATYLPDTADGPIRPGSPTLNVRDLGRVARYYEEQIGLQRIDAEADTIRLGAGGRTLLVLRKRDVDLEPSGFAGLFHTAFLLPSRGDLGRWLHRAIKANVTLDGASDHAVSEALYLTDPEGNGIEIYADRPRSAWHWSGDQVTLTTNQLDIRQLIAAGGSSDVTVHARVPDATTVGHIHLRVGGIPEAEAFYRDVLGLEVTARRNGATFYATGRYHHHIATNTWQSRNAPKRTGATTGLAAFELIARDRLTFDTAAERLLSIGAKRDGETIEAADPWGNLVRLKHA
jgi:catechol 2,3-dioxygenase